MHARSTTVKSEAETGKRMGEDALEFLRGLTAGQREKVSFAVSSDERMNWHYIPRPRKGLALKEMDELQRRLAWVLISSGLSREGWRKAMRIMGLEKILGEIEGPSARFERDPGLFYLSIFGDPAGESPWGWRLEGHHVSLNFLVAGGEGVGCTPNFMGANPAPGPPGISPGRAAHPGGGRGICPGAADQPFPRTAPAERFQQRGSAGYPHGGRPQGVPRYAARGPGGQIE